ncbi:acyl-[acyl-carrier-protein] thioesterase [Desulfovibrio ferrophilus]|uniref:Acyl-ACP thioesterase n=1 Tax=Desulfovibrio ferrophilus TaxID=241368 RepID=A0A2Z6B078_9BACT|nr:acyl-ACP thioesterase domain-containing protein [Desulfovibrio ferrophilus]BBD08796.1 acyl-ACP thioesterase [Desulfovibrio ferrophilus]
MTRTYTEPFKVRIYETTADYTTSIGTIADWLQEAATIHAGRLGFSNKEMVKAGVAWVLSRLCIRMERYPVYGETITVCTWPTTRNKRRAARDYRLTDESGAIIGTGTSSWVALDLATRRLGSMPDFVLERFPNQDERACEFTAKSLPKLQATQHEAIVTARAADQDQNGHVNNVHLLKWGLEPIPNGRPRFQPSVVDIAFRAEILPGERATAGCATGVEPNTMLHTLIRSDGTEAVRMLTHWS